MYRYSRRQKILSIRKLLTSSDKAKNKERRVVHLAYVVFLDIRQILHTAFGNHKRDAALE